jgi:hypothetical protein
MLHLKQKLRWLMLLLLFWTNAPIVAPLLGSETSSATQGTSANQSEADETVVIPRGKENLPAEEVFKNVEILKGQPASRLRLLPSPKKTDQRE